MDDSKLTLQFSSDWNILKELRKKLMMRLKDDLLHMAEPVIMASLELAANAIKYGDSKLCFTLNVDEDCVEIRISNTLGSAGNYDLLKERIEKIQKSDDKFGLYTERLREMIDNPGNGPTRLGLNRIAYEGKLSLDCDMKNRMVGVCAKRRLDKGEKN